MLSAVSSICVQIVQKNLEVGLRIKLFRAVLSQDIVFFDGMMTGQISSRIQSVRFRFQLLVCILLYVIILPFLSLL